jgi:hypothetical protein
MNRPYEDFELLDSCLGILLSGQLDGGVPVFFTEAHYSWILY